MEGWLFQEAEGNNTFLARLVSLKSRGNQTSKGPNTQFCPAHRNGSYIFM